MGNPSRAWREGDAIGVEGFDGDDPGRDAGGKALAEEPPERPPAGIFLVSMPFIGKEGWPSDEIKPEPDLGAKLPAQSPVYLYQGSADETVPAKHAELNAKAIPQAMVHKLSGRDHQLDNDMSEVAADIRELSRRKPSRE